MLRDFNGLSVATMDSSLQDDIQTHHGRPRTASADAPDTLDTLIQIICSGDIDLLLFTEADQVRALLARAAGQDLTAPLRDALRQIAIG